MSVAAMPDGSKPGNEDPTGRGQNSSEEWLLLRIGVVPRNSLGWFRCGVGFYNKKEYTKSIECFEKSVELDPMNVRLVDEMNSVVCVNECLPVLNNRKDDAIAALKQSVMLDNPSDWQLLVELTSNSV
ncbi:hypothetical protein HDU77_003096 [Chytriomyces hyalinus]|nr:hypothetical protein HDU77_003096 [Chytriomyces hyalinus]